MPTPDELSFSAYPVPIEKLRRLIIGRAGLILLHLFANLWRTGAIDQAMAGALDLRRAFSDGLLPFFGATLLLTGVYAALASFGGRHHLQARLQFAIDLVLITWLVWRTGDIGSPYITLYIVLISVAGFFLNKSATLFLSIACAVFFTVLALLVTGEMIYSASGEQPVSRSVQLIGMNVVAILLVGLLSARLSERRRIGEQLQHTEESFADLHILHERIVESIQAGLITTDLEGRIYAFNRAAAEFTRIPAAEAIGLSVFDIFGPEARRHALRCLTGTDSPATFEAVFGDDNGNGPRRTASCSVVPLRGKDGAVTGLIVTFQDISHMKALEETVRRSDRLAAVGRMAAGLAHEIRNPLGSMSSALQFLQAKETRAAEDGALMNVVLRESDRLNGIITDFLAFARPSAKGHEGTRREDVDVAIALRDCMSLIKHSPDAGDGHEFKCLLPDEPVIITANEAEIKQVFWNLAQNAIQAMPDGGKLSATLEQPMPGRVRVTFTDTGTGIADEILEHIFEPFTSGSGGTGLGLSIVYNIVRSHNGKIDVQSKRGRGTRIAVELRGASPGKR
ncbi:MAG: ATP-binding protein [Pyrinomonadaceae bacterium]|nr:ATP-binding protein [Pyrinomonadaceae bacterium]